MAAQSGGDRHAAKAADHARNHADHRYVGAQRHDRLVYLSHSEQPEVGLLQPDAACLQEQHGADRIAALGVTQGQPQRAGYLGAGDLTDATPLEEPLDGEHDRLLAVELAAGHHNPVVTRGDHALGQPEGDGAGRGAGVVDLDGGGEVIAGEEAVEHRLPDLPKPIDAGADDNVGLLVWRWTEQNLQVTRADDANVRAMRYGLRGRIVEGQCFHFKLPPRGLGQRRRDPPGRPGTEPRRADLRYRQARRCTLASPPPATAARDGPPPGGAGLPGPLGAPEAGGRRRGETLPPPPPVPPPRRSASRPGNRETPR